MAVSAQITGWGKYVPQRVLTNFDLEQMVETSDEWIRQRTGIRERRIAAEGETTSTMAIRAAQDALARARLSPAQIDLIIVATVTPDHLFPSTACLVQDGLGAIHAAAFDLSAGCTGFVYGLHLAAQLIRAEAYRNILVIGAETLSRIIDWSDRNTCVLFGDGAGAVVVQPTNDPTGIIDGALHADGSGGELLIVPAGGSCYPASEETVARNMHTLRMNGRAVFRFATRAMADAVREVVEKTGLTLDEVNLIIPHQANIRIIQSAAKALQLPEERFYVNLDRYGNTSAASIPIALCEAAEEGRINPGDVLVLTGFGAGLTWGGLVMRWGLVTPTELPRGWRRWWMWIYYRWAYWRSRVRRLWRAITTRFSKQKEEQRG